MKLLKTVRADPSDTFIFGHAAEAGEWAVSGAFVFAHLEPGRLEGRIRAEFRSGFLGLTSLGRSTLVQVVEADAIERMAATTLLAQQLVDRFGAPDLTTAIPAAAEEIGFAADLCEHPVGMLIAVSRRFEEGVLRESFRALHPRTATGPIRVFALDRTGVPDET